MIEIKKKSEQKFVVTIKERDGKTEHEVTLDDKYYQNNRRNINVAIKKSIHICTH